MIWLYTGTPGSGKSYHAVYDIVKKLKQTEKNRVIANFGLNFDNQRKKYKKQMYNNFIYLDNSEMTVDFLVDFAIKNHEIGVENQTLVVIDEAQIIFNSRTWNIEHDNRMRWIKFFSQHRKFGYNFILVTQFDRMIDRQIRSLVEYEVSHMKINSYFAFLPFVVFLCVERWYGQKMKIRSYTLLLKKKIYECYNSYLFFDKEYNNVLYFDKGKKEGSA